jgi:hypothetical protein
MWFVVRPRHPVVLPHVSLRDLAQGDPARREPTSWTTSSHRLKADTSTAPDRAVCHTDRELSLHRWGVWPEVIDGHRVAVPAGPAGGVLAVRPRGA